MLFKKQNKKIKVMGSIVNYQLIDGKHYPIFHFVTEDGKVIEKINDTIIQGEMLDYVEAVYNEEGIKEFLARPLPINDIPIYYNKDNPNDFYGKWI